MSLIHPSPEFAEIVEDDKVTMLMFQLNEIEYVTVGRAGVYHHLIPIECIQTGKMNLNDLPQFNPEKTVEADYMLSKIAERYVEMAGSNILKLQSIYQSLSSEPWVELTSKDEPLKESESESEVG